MNIPIAKEFWNKACRTDELKSPADIMIEFAKLHVQAALKEASEKAELNYADGKHDCPEYCEEPFNMTCDDLGNCHYIDRSLILNAYPLENVK